MLSETEAKALGICPIDRLSRSFQVEPRATSADTIGGYLSELADRALVAGESIQDTDLVYTILEGTGPSLMRLKISVKQPEIPT